MIPENVVVAAHTVSTPRIPCAHCVLAALIDAKLEFITNFQI